LMAVVVLPTPPFWLATAMTRPMGYRRRARVSRVTPGVAARNREMTFPQMFYEEQLWKSFGDMLITWLERFPQMFYVEQLVNLKVRRNRQSALFHFCLVSPRISRSLLRKLLPYST
jgi:hypothetical protein